jgi:mannose-6-phosphate isomerase-like protein (cupin superfamily)
LIEMASARLGRKQVVGKFHIALATLLGACTLCTAAAANPPATDDQKTAAELKAMAGTPVNGLSVVEIWSGPGFRVLSNQRNGPGEVEVHAKVNDVFVIEEGKAIMILGGHVDGGRETAPNEMRGGTIIGGQTRKLAPGDVLWVPAGQPHKIIPEAGRNFRYEVIKVEARATTPAQVPKP